MNNPAYIDWSPVRSYDITWNFAKVRPIEIEIGLRLNLNDSDEIECEIECEIEWNFIL